MSYTDVQTDGSKKCLKTLMVSIPRPHCLIGGWSVYLIVNEAYKADTGREYQGSRDISLGFHFDPQWDKKQFDDSPFANTVVEIEKMSFHGMYHRFYKEFHATEGRDLTKDEVS